MKNIKEFVQSGKPLAMIVSVAAATLVLTSLIDAATTISTNIQTDGTLSVTGVSTLTGAVNAVGLVTSGSASTTIFSVNNTAFFGGTATTTISRSGNITQGTTNAATTTLAIGCVTTFATSTATAIRFVASPTIYSTSTFQGSNNVSQGLVVWQYGSCPI